MKKIIIIIIILLATTQGMCVPYTINKAVGQRQEFPHQSHSKGPLSHYRFMALSTYKCISTKRLLLLIHVTNFARCCILCLQICPVSGAPLVCVRSTVGPSPELLWEVEITGPVMTTKTRTYGQLSSFQEHFLSIRSHFYPPPTNETFSSE